MTLQEYNEIMIEAKRRYEQYCSLQEQANISILIARKEDQPEYWVAVVAKERAFRGKE